MSNHPITVHRTRGGDFVATFATHDRRYQIVRRSRAALDAALAELRPVWAELCRAEADLAEARRHPESDLASRRAALVARYRRLRSCLSP
jgi:hypothetical protein